MAGWKLNPNHQSHSSCRPITYEGLASSLHTNCSSLFFSNKAQRIHLPSCHPHSPILMTNSSYKRNGPAAAELYRFGIYLDVPMYIEDVEYCGEDTANLQAWIETKKKERLGRNDTARRIVGCPLEEEDQCDTLIWVDPEWHPKVQKAFDHMWTALDLASQD
uniref:Uncharacterized protein n=1 Tax=Oryza punctata TaxID=4537 RepID=A0A0E0KPF3_ORYPU